MSYTVEYHSAIKRNKRATTWMDPKSVVLQKAKKTQKSMYHIIPLKFPGTGLKGWMDCQGASGTLGNDRNVSFLDGTGDYMSIHL